MWEALEKVHLPKRPGARFHAYDNLLGIQKEPDKDLSGLIKRVDDAINLARDLRPANFTMDDLDGELVSMALIRSLPEEFKTFRSSLFLLPQLNRDTVAEAFLLEEADEKHRKQAAEAQALALKAAMAANAATSVVPSVVAESLFCDWCKRAGHSTKDCRTMARIQEQEQKCRQASRAKDHSAKEVHHESANFVEYAGNASAYLSDLTSPLVTDASTDWNPDTGATSHMTPHRHWFNTYKPYVVPIRLADNNIIHSAGVGSVLFQAVINGRTSILVEFT